MASLETLENVRKRVVIEKTQFMLRKHYCENEVEPIIAQMDDEIHWLGAGEHEYAVGLQTVAEIFRRFVGQVPKCNISGEEYHALQLAADVYMCTGRLWVAAGTNAQDYLRVHQRITTVFRWINDQPKCCHIHISNPYIEMTEDDCGFPVKMAQQSYLYLQEQIEAQKQQITAQTAMLQKMSYEDSLTQLFNRNKFNQLLHAAADMEWICLGVAYFDLNGLKCTNDHLGHSAGDSLLCRAAEQIRRVFDGKAYRTGGDEFVVIDDTLSEEEFKSAVHTVQKYMDEADISYSIGISWRNEKCCLKEQLDEADRRMYQAKKIFYGRRENDRRK